MKKSTILMIVILMTGYISVNAQTEPQYKPSIDQLYLTVRGWGMALLLCEINPDAQNELFKLGYEWGQSRVIAGYHWQSDVDASRMLAVACYARLHACEEILKDMAEARKEFKKQSR